MSAISAVGSGLLPAVYPIRPPAAVGHVITLGLSADALLTSNISDDILECVPPKGVWAVSASVLFEVAGTTISSYEAVLNYPNFTAIGHFPSAQASGVTLLHASASVSGVVVADGVSTCALVVKATSTSGAALLVGTQFTIMQLVKIA